jgi:hypothetical protein
VGGTSLHSKRFTTQDEENKNGGKFIVTVPRGKRTTSKYWEELLLAVVGSQFGVPDDEICGVVCDFKCKQYQHHRLFQRDIIKISCLFGQNTLTTKI